jgi:dihydroorotate dehydrogenase subfamily 2
MLYKRFLKPILFRFDPELVHNAFVLYGQSLRWQRPKRWFISKIYGYHASKNGGKDISKTVDGIRYRIPILLSAGFDYNGKLTNVLPNLAFGGEEVGSVTARACPGNPKPRLRRLPHSQSIIVNKGLRNDGVDRIIQRLKKVKRAAKFVIGVSIARTNDEKSAQSIQAGIDDYAYSFRRLNEEHIGDYYTINISCPNAFGGETFATPENLSKLLPALKAIPCSKPIYVKMPINLSWTEFNELLKIIDQNGLEGVVIGNLNKNYADLDVREEAPKDYCGGLSGKPCKALSTELIKKTREVYGKRFTIIGVGGIMSVEDAQEKFNAGADLIQLITGMIYEGPGLMKEIAESLSVNSLKS